MKVTWCLTLWYHLENQPFAWESQPTGDQLEQPIGTRTHRLRKPTQRTGDVADKWMVQVSDLAWRSTSYSVDSVAQKKQKLDLSTVPSGEPNGGWGRTIGGADTMIQKMLKNPDTAIEASELKTHLDFVRLCRTMQPTKIEGMLQDDLDQGLSALELAGVTLPTETVPNDENVSAFMDCAERTFDSEGQNCRDCRCFWLLRRVMVMQSLSYCFSAVSKDHEYDHPVTLLPSAAALLSVTFHDPGSLQLLSGWKDPLLFYL